MSPASEIASTARKGNHWRATACDLLAFLAVPCTLLAVAWFRDATLACNIALMVALLGRIWLTPDTLTLLPADLVVLAISAAALLRLPFGLDLGAHRIAALFTGVLLYWTLRTVRRRLIAIRWTLFAVGSLGALLAAYSFLGSHAWITRVHAAGFQDVTALKGTLVSVLRGPVNEWATVLLLLLVLQAAAIQPAAGRFFARNVVAICALIALSAALCLTFSRGAYAAAAAFAIGITLAALVVPRFRRAARNRLIAAACLVVAASALGANAISGGAVARTARFNATEQQRRSSAGRFRVWASAAELTSNHALAGTGPGTFAMRYVPKAGLDEGRSFVGRPLNTVLALLVEEGLAGVALQALLALLILVAALRGIFRMPATGAYRVGVLAAGCCAFWIREMTFSSLLENQAVMCLYWVLLALLVLGTFPAALKAPYRTAKGVSRIALTLLAGASVLVVFCDERSKGADKAARIAVQSVRSGDAGGALEAADRAIAIRPAPYYLGLRALIGSQESMPAFDPRQVVRVADDPSRGRRLQAALRDLDRALAGNPDDDVFWHNRAWIRLSLGTRPQQVIPDMRRAIEIDGGTPAYRVSLGLMFELQGQVEDARKQYAAALAAAPDICDSEFARDLKMRATTLWDGALSTAVRILYARDPNDLDVAARARLARLYLEQGQTERARKMLETVTRAMPQYPRAWANQGRIYLDAGDFAQAGLSLKKAAFLDGGDPIVRSLLARVATANGDQEAAEDLQSQALMIAGQPVSAHAKRVSRVYKTNAAVRDDVLPPGLLAYCSPSPSIPQNNAQQEPKPERALD